jgi:hypothetical protein
MLKNKIIEELVLLSTEMLNLIVEAEEQDPDFTILRELLEQFDDEVKAIVDE